MMDLHEGDEVEIWIDGKWVPAAVMFLVDVPEGLSWLFYRQDECPVPRVTVSTDMLEQRVRRPKTAESRLAALRQALAKAQADLTNAVAGLCPGPHAAIQHRDRKPPWCNVCGYDDYGLLRRT